MRKKILVVDASETIINVCRTLLIQHGYDAVLYQDGTRALEELKRSQYDLAIIATTCRNTTGYFVLKELRKHSARRTMPVLLLLGSSELADTRELLESGADATLSKPFSPQELLVRIEKLLNISPAEQHKKDDEFDVENILGDDQNSLNRKISEATDKIFLAALGNDQPSAELPPRPHLDRMEVGDEQYGFQIEETGLIPEERGPHDYEWFISEMKGEPTRDAEASKRVVSMTSRKPGTSKFQIEEIGTSKISLDQLKKMQEVGEVDKTKVYIEKLHEPWGETEAQKPVSSDVGATADPTIEFVQRFAEALAKEIVKNLDMGAILQKLEDSRKKT